MRRLLLAALCIGLSAQAAVGQSLDGRLKTIKDTATLRIAYRTDSRPFSYVDGQGQPNGYTIELCKRVSESIGRELALPSLAIKWVPVDARTRFEAIIGGAADMECGSTTVSLSRLKLVDFSSIVFADSTGVLVKADAGIISFESMAGKRIGVVPGSTNMLAIVDQLKRRKLEATLVEISDRDAGFAALTRGAVDGFATDKLVLLAFMRRTDARDLSLLPDDLSFEPFAIVLPQGDWALRLAVNTGLAKIFRSGEVIQIYNKYFGELGYRPSVWLGAVFMFGGLPD